MSDLRFAFRQMLKSPGLTAVAVLTLALGVGANTAIFSLENSLLFHTVTGVREPARLLAFDFKPGDKPAPLPVFSYPDFLHFQQAMDVFDGMAAFRMAVVTVGTEEQARKTQALLVSPNWFRFLGARIVAGRGFAADEGKKPGADAVAVISQRLWRGRFNSDPSVVGQSVELNDHAFTIVGVAAPFHLDPLLTSDVWVPLTMHAQLETLPRGLINDEVDPLMERRRSWVRWLARLKPGVSLEQAQAAVAVRSRQLGDSYGASTIMGSYPLTVVLQSDYNRRQMERAGQVGVFLLVLAALVLLIACANLANLLLASATSRRQEIAVRLALGAGRTRLIRQLLTEGILLALLGGLAGTLLSNWTANLFGGFVSEVGSRAAFPIQYEVILDWNVFAYALLVSVFAGLAFTLAPAIRASRSNLMAALKGEAEAPIRGARRLTWRNALVIGQVAICFLLLAVAGLFTRGLQKAETVDLGFRPESVLVMPIDLELRKIPAAEARSLYERIRERLLHLPGVSRVSFARFCQGDPQDIPFNYEPAGDTRTNFYASGNIVGLDYFQTLGTPILRGRDFTAADLSGPPVVIVNETMAKQLWPGQEAIGQEVKTAQLNNPKSSPAWAAVIGVAKDGHYLSLYQHDRRPFLYCPHSPSSAGNMTLFVRVNGDYRVIWPALRNELRALDSRLPAYELIPLADRIAVWRLLPQMGAILVGSIGLLGLFLALLGLYSLLAYVVGQRTKEFGIRLALGARRTEVIALVMRQGLWLVVFGSAIGLLAALASTRVIAGLLFGVSPLDLTAFAAVALLLTTVALVACYLPARRATKVDPMVALRYE